MKCPHDRRLLAFLDGELRPGTRDAVNRHIERCESCRERVKAFEEFKHVVRETPAGVDDDEARRFVRSLPEHAEPLGTAWRGIGLASAFAAALVLGVVIGRAILPPQKDVEVQTVASVPQEGTVSALAALQRLKLALADERCAREIRNVETYLCESLSEGGNVTTVRAVRLIEEGEDAAAERDFASAASFFENAAKVCEGTELAVYAGLQHVAALAEAGYYDTAIEKLAALSVADQNEMVSREAGYRLATCQLALGDTWGAGATVDTFVRQGAGDNRLAELALAIGDRCYDETFDFERAQGCYSVWAELTADVDARLRKAKETRARLALLEESAEDSWEPLLLYLRAEKAYPYEAQSLYAQLVSTYPENSLADSAFVKWYGLEQARRQGEMLASGRVSDLARWETVAASDAPDEMRAYARLKIADRLHAQLDGVEEVVLAYREVVEEFPRTSTAYIARERADVVRDTIRRKGEGFY